MKINGFLTINNKEGCKFTKTKTGIDWNEIQISISIELPNSLFTRPTLQADIKISGDFENKFNAEVKNNLSEIINSQKDLHLVKVNILPSEKEDKK